MVAAGPTGVFWTVGWMKEGEADGKRGVGNGGARMEGNGGIVSDFYCTYGV